MFGKRAHQDESDDLVVGSEEPVSPSIPAVTKVGTTIVSPINENVATLRVDQAKTAVFNTLVDEIDLAELNKRETKNLHPEIREVIEEIISAKKLVLSSGEQQQLADEICNDVLGLGPLEPLLQDESITEIMVNDAKTVFVERNGLIERANVQFKDEARLMNVCTRIATAVGRRINETNPMCDARLPDGSRVNIVVPPLSLRGASLTIRKFKKKSMTLESLVDLGGMTTDCATLLKAAAASKVSILVSGGTGSGKTTLLNALSEHIDERERLITIEDTAELQLCQPNIVNMEARQSNLEGVGAVSQRDLLRNALRMRPDRIILGEVRGEEAIDMLQAMNTGHEGSMGTIHANSPHDAIVRLENMVAMGNFGLSERNVRRQIASAIGLIVQVSRLKDGSRRVVNVSETTGTDVEAVALQDLFAFHHLGEDTQGKVTGDLRSSGVRPNFTRQASYFNRDNEVLRAMGIEV